MNKKFIKSTVALTCALTLSATVVSVINSNAVNAAKKASKTITVWEQDETNIDTAYNKIDKAFEKKYNIKINRVHFKNEDLRNQFQSAVLSGKGPDLILGPNDNAGPLSKSGLIQPADKFFSKWSALDKKAVSSVEFDGSKWLVPDRNGNNISLIYNKNLVKTPPKTFDDIIKFAKTFNNESQKKYALTYYENEPFFWIGFLGGYNGKVFKTSKAKDASLNTSAMVKAFQLAQDLKYKYKVIPVEADYNAAETAFKTEKSAMILQGSWAFADYTKTCKFPIGIVTVPKVLGGTYAQPYYGTKGFSVSRNAKDKASIKKYLEFVVTTKSNQIELAKASSQVPTLLSAKKDKQITSDKLIAASLNQIDQGEPMPIRPEMRAVWDSLRPALEKVMAKKTTPKAAAKEAQDLYKTNVKALK